MALIDLKNIFFSYSSKDSGGFYLSNISLSVEQGEFLTILGPNGAGKSTLLRIISGILKPISGEIKLKDRPYHSISKRNLARSIAFVPQSALTIFPFSIYEIVMMGRTPYLNMIGFETKSDRDIVEEALEMVDISHLKAKGINEVSGGEAQRAFIARAIVQRPEILLLDEPNAHLDIKHQLAVFDLLRKLNLRKNLTVISVSHDLNLAGFYSKRVLLMKSGSVFMDGDVETTMTEGNIRKVFEVDSSIISNTGAKTVSVMIKPAHLK